MGRFEDELFWSCLACRGPSQTLAGHGASTVVFMPV